MSSYVLVFAHEPARALAELRFMPDAGEGGRVEYVPRVDDPEVRRMLELMRRRLWSALLDDPDVREQARRTSSMPKPRTRAQFEAVCDELSYGALILHRSSDPPPPAVVRANTPAPYQPLQSNMLRHERHEWANYTCADCARVFDTGDQDRPCPTCGQFPGRGIVRCWHCGARFEILMPHQYRFCDLFNAPCPSCGGQVMTPCIC